MASPTGQCQAFSEKADGYARGEGCGIIIIERLGDALKNGHNVWATIQTGCNQDGQTVKPITQPSETQQRQLLHQVYQKQNIDPANIQYIEAHGTGTPVGDPIEVTSLGTFFQEHPMRTSAKDGYRMIGSVKTNIGHLESGAGAASLIKVLLMMKNERIVPSLHSGKLNTKIDFEKYKFHVPHSDNNWPTSKQGHRWACVNCFGFGGTNSHAVVKQYKPNLPFVRSVKQSSCLCCTFVVITATSPSSLHDNIVRFRDTIDTNRDVDLDTLSFTTTCKRNHYRFRVCFLVNSIDDLNRQCSDTIEKYRDTIQQNPKFHRVIFAFCGVGTAWTGMGYELFEKNIPSFVSSIREVDHHLVGLTGWSIESKLRARDSLSDPLISHIAIFACQIGLAAFWKECGVLPDAVLGQSVGEVAASYCAGCLTLKDAVKVIYFRSLVLAQPTDGRMCVIRNVDSDIVEQTCNQTRSGRVNIAVYISPVACTISGDASAVTEVKDSLLGKFTNTLEQPIFTDLGVKTAYHSHLVENAANKFAKLLNELTHAPAKTIIYSSVTGSMADEAFASIEYWKANIRKPVLFSKALKLAGSISEKHNIIVEIGPRPVIRAHLSNIFQPKEATTCASMVHGKGIDTLSKTIKEVFCLGVDLNWESFVPSFNCRTDFPKYKFERQKLFLESDFRAEKRKGIENRKSSLMISRKQGLDNWFNVKIDPTSTFFVYNHVIEGVIVIPGATYAEIAYELAMCLLALPTECIEISCYIDKPVILQRGTPLTMDMNAVISEADGKRTVNFSVVRNDTIFAGGDITERQVLTTKQVNITHLQANLETHVSGEQVYSELSSLGYTYESPVQVLTSMWYHQSECLAEIQLTERVFKQINQTTFHPSVLDAMLHSSALMFFTLQLKKIYPTAFGSIVVNKPMQKHMFCFTRFIKTIENRLYTNMILTQEDGEVIAEVKEVEHTMLDSKIHLSSMAYQIEWRGTNLPFEAKSSNLEEEKGFFLTLNDDLKRDIEDSFPDIRISHVDCLNTDNTEVQLSKYFVDIDKMDSFVYAPGLDNSYLFNDSTGENVFNLVKTTCKVFMDTMRHFKQTNKIVFVVTENTQCVDTETSTEGNVLGSELWGFSRALLQESAYCRIVLIDVQPSIRREQIRLSSLINAVLGGTMDDLSECILTHDKLYTNILLNCKKTSLNLEHRRKFEMEEQSNVELRSTKSNSIQNAFLKNHETSNQYHCDQTQEVFIESVYLHSSSDFPVTESNSNVEEMLWSEYKADGYPAVAIEFEGHILDSNKSAKQIQSEKVVVCYPLKIRRIVYVPRNCIIEKSDLPFYQPGLVRSALLAKEIVSCIPKKRKVAILTKECENNLNALILKIFLECNNQCYVTLITIAANKKTYIGSDRNVISIISENPVMVVISDEMDAFLTEAVSTTCTTSLIVAFQDATLQQTRQIIQLRSCNTKFISIDKQMIFEPKYLVRNIPDIRKWLIANHKQIYESLENGPPCTPKQESLNTLTIFGPEASIEIKPSKSEFARKDAAYIVIGGLSGLGWEIVKWLCRSGAGVVVTFSRKSGNAEKKKKDEKMTHLMDTLMEMYGCIVKSLVCDISDMESIRVAFKQIELLFPSVPIKGLFQGAGILKDVLFEQMDMDLFEQVLKPKVLGTWNLHLATKNMKLDYFVMHSSVASVFGNRGQTNYSSANAFMDSLAFYRRSVGLAGQTINWSVLSLGMASDEKLIKHLQTLGYFPLDSSNIIKCLRDALIKNPTQIVYGLFDWPSVRGNSIQVALLKKNDGKALPKLAVKSGSSPSLDLNAFLKLSEAEQLEYIHALLVKLLSSILNTEPTDLYDDVSFHNLGLDSRMATEMIDVFYESTRVKIPFVFFEDPTYSIKRTVVFVHDQLTNEISTDDEVIREKTVILLETLSYGEKLYYDLQREQPIHPGVWFCTDFLLGTECAKIDLWKKIAKWLTIKHPELRTYLQPNVDNVHFGVQKRIVDPVDSTLNFVVVDQSEFNSPISDVYQTFDHADASSLRIIYDNSGKTHRIRFIMAHTLLDLKSVLLLFQTIDDFLYKRLELCKIPDLTPYSFFDVATIMDQKLVHAKEDLEQFWNSELQNIGLPITVCKPPVTIQQPSGKVNSVAKKLPKALIDRISALSITVEQMFCGLYQLLLHKITGNNVIPIILCTDIRRHFPELESDRMMMGTNFVPVITCLSDTDCTLHDYVQQCATQVENANRNSLYPYYLLKSMPEYNSEIHRHHIRLSECILKSNRANRKDNWMRKVGQQIGYLNDMETALLIHQEDKEMNVRLQYDSNIIDELTAMCMLSDLQFLIKLLLGRPTVNIDDISIETFNSTSTRSRVALNDSKVCNVL